MKDIFQRMNEELEKFNKATEKLKPKPSNMAINIIFDGPPSHESGRFVEVETDDGRSIRIGEWIDRGDGLWALRITSLPSESETLSNEMQYPSTQ